MVRVLGEPPALVIPRRPNMSTMSSSVLTVSLLLAVVDVPAWPCSIEINSTISRSSDSSSHRTGHQLR